MKSRYNVWLNDIALSDLSPTIYLYDIQYTPVSPSRASGKIGKADGKYTQDEDTVSENKIRVMFEVHEYDTTRRQETVQDIIRWANKGGWLKCSDRPGQKIYARVTAYPAVASALRWTDNLVMEFTATDYPFWVNENAETLTLNSGDEGDIYNPGFRKSYVEANIVPSETMTGFSLECGDTFMEFSGLNVPANQPIRISYTEDHHFLKVETGGVSILDKRTPESSDDLLIAPGEGYVYFECLTGAECTVMVRGVWL